MLYKSMCPCIVVWSVIKLFPVWQVQNNVISKQTTLNGLGALVILSGFDAYPATIIQVRFLKPPYVREIGIKAAAAKAVVVSTVLKRHCDLDRYIKVELAKKKIIFRGNASYSSSSLRFWLSRKRGIPVFRIFLNVICQYCGLNKPYLPVCQLSSTHIA